MPVIQKVISLDELFHSSRDKIIVNDFDPLDPDFRLEYYLATKYEETISLIPTCVCGKSKGTYLEGRTCPYCNTTIEPPGQRMEPKVWISQLHEDIPFLNPYLWKLVGLAISSKIDGLRYLSDPFYNPPKIPPVLNNLKNLIGGRSYLNTIKNLKNILIYLKSNSQFQSERKQIHIKETLNLLDSLPDDKIYSHYLPIIHKALVIVERSGNKNYTSASLADLIEMSSLVIGVKTNPNITFNKLQAITARLISKTANLFEQYLSLFMGQKEGVIRKNILGTRANFTFRCVASSLRSIYEYDTVHVPWVVGIAAFRPHLLNKLVNRGYSYREASNKIFAAAMKYDNEIDENLQELIEESPFKGIPVLANRNPTLGQNSIVRVFITRFKTNPEDRTVNFSINIGSSLNLDYDGSQDSTSCQ